MNGCWMVCERCTTYLHTVWRLVLLLLFNFISKGIIIRKVNTSLTFELKTACFCSLWRYDKQKRLLCRFSKTIINIGITKLTKPVGLNWFFVPKNIKLITKILFIFLILRRELNCVKLKINHRNTSQQNI